MPGFLWIAVLIASLPLMVRHFLNMWRVEAYHYLPALVLLIALLVFQRWDRQLRLPSTWFQWLFLAFGAGLLLMGTFLYSPWLAALGTSCLLCSFFLCHRDEETGSSMIGMWPLSLLWLPLPAGLDDALTTELQRQSSRLSSFVLDILDVPHTLQGNVIELPQGRLFVEEACSGVQSLFTIVFLSLAIVVFNRRSLWQLPVYLLAAGFWAGIMNVARLVTIGFVRDRYDLDWSHGAIHQIIGYFYLAMAGLFLLSSDRFFRVFFFPTSIEKAGARINNPIIGLWNRLFSEELGMDQNTSQERRLPVPAIVPNLCVGVFAILACASGFQVVSRSMRSAAVASTYEESFLGYSENLNLDGITIVDHEKLQQKDIGLPFGQNADVWKGRVGVLPATLAISQPYPKWHNLNDCYIGVGWTLNETDHFDITDEEGDEITYSHSTFVHEDGRYAYLWWMAFDETGMNVKPATSSLLDRFKYYVLSREKKTSTVENARIAIAQMFVESSGPVDLDFNSNLETVFTDFRKLAVSLGVDTQIARNSTASAGMNPDLVPSSLEATNVP